MGVNGQKTIRQEDCPFPATIDFWYDGLFHFCGLQKDNKRFIVLFIQRKVSALFPITQVITSQHLQFHISQ